MPSDLPTPDELAAMQERCDEYHDTSYTVNVTKSYRDLRSDLADDMPRLLTAYRELAEENELLTNFVSYAASCRRSNTMDWLEGLVEKMNEFFVMKEWKSRAEIVNRDYIAIRNESLLAPKGAGDGR